MERIARDDWKGVGELMLSSANKLPEKLRARGPEFLRPELNLTI